MSVEEPETPPPDDGNPPEETGGRPCGAGAPATSSQDVTEPSEEAAPHDDTGLDLARTLAKSIAGAAVNAPRKRRRRSGGRGGTEQPGGRGQRGRGRRTGSGAHPDDRDPQLLDSTLGRLVSDQGWAMDLKVHGVFGRWPTIVGAQVAEHCTPTSYVDGRLTVRTDSTAWATQLRLLAPTLVKRLNEELGHGSVTLIEVEGPNLPSWKKGRFGVRDGRGPRDTYG